MELARTAAAETRAAAEAGLVEETRDLATAIAARALAAEPPPATAAAYAARLAPALAAMAPEARASLLAAPGLTLVAATAPGRKDLAAARAALPDLPPDTPLTLDPALLAGLELRSGAGVVHNSLAHDLDHVATALKPEAAA